MSLAEVVNLPVSNLNDIPAMLRKAADSLEDGSMMPATAAVLALEFEDGDVEPFGWGSELGDATKALGLMHLAIHKLTHIRLEEFD